MADDIKTLLLGKKLAKNKEKKKKEVKKELATNKIKRDLKGETGDNRFL